MAEIYKDPIIKKYQELIEASMPGLFRSMYQGDPIMIPKSSMPALVISKSRTRTGVLTNTEDEQEIALILTVVTDLRDEINDDKQMVPGIAQLYDIIEGREDDTFKLKTNSILHVLRSNVVVDQANNLRTDLGSITTVDYGITVNKRAQGSFSIEGQVQFNAQYSQLRA
jgi:hypothetical protein